MTFVQHGVAFFSYHSFRGHVTSLLIFIASEARGPFWVVISFAFTAFVLCWLISIGIFLFLCSNLSFLTCKFSIVRNLGVLCVKAQSLLTVLTHGVRTVSILIRWIHAVKIAAFYLQVTLRLLRKSNSQKSRWMTSTPLSSTSRRLELGLEPSTPRSTETRSTSREKKSELSEVAVTIAG